MAASSTRRYPSHWKTTQGGLRPPRYATPPPPDRKQYIEPISPVGYDFPTDIQPSDNYHTSKANHLYSNDAHGLGLSLKSNNINGDSFRSNNFKNGYSPAVIDDAEWSPRSGSHSRILSTENSHPIYSPGGKTKHKGHHRSASTIDTLATVALATSPTFAHTTPLEQGGWSATPLFNDLDYDGETYERPSKRAKSEKLASPLLNRKDLRPATSHVASIYDSTMRNDAELLLNFARPAANNSHWAPFGRSTRGLDFSAGPLSQYVEPDQPPHSPLTPPPAPLLYFTSSTTNDHSPKNSKQAVLEHEPIQHETETETVAVQLGPSSELPTTTTDSKEIDSAAHEAGIKEDITDRQSGLALVDLDNETSPAPEMDITLETGTPQHCGNVLSSVDSPHDVSTKEAKTRKKKAALDSICAKCNNNQLTAEALGQKVSEDWIECSACNKWYHYRCAGLKEEREAQAIDKYICAECEPVYGSTTFVRKSSRPRTMIDYTSLNEGVIQTSSETNEHLYSRALREGTLKFQADDFARVRPDMATIEQLENSGSGWTRPIVIPAKWNPRHPRHARNLRLIESFDREHSPPLEAFEEQEIEDEEYMSDREYEEVYDVGQDALGMVIPNGLTVPMVSELIGPDEKVVDVIDVKTQNGVGKKWSMRQWTDYYESKDPNKSIRNVISLEVSKTKLGRVIRRPQVVRDMDILDHVWPKELQSQPEFPAVQFYCLMSVADCYTDFHIDFGGSSVYYHIVKGKKTFFFIPPEERNIKKYEDWCNSGQQNAIFLGDQCSECRRVDLSEGDTMLIPAGWIHAVWTPEDSLVIGGNFLTRTNYEMQFRIWQSEITIKIPQQFRYPNFQKVMWYAALDYLEEDPVPETVIQAFQSDAEYKFSREMPVWHELTRENPAAPGSEAYNARHYPKREILGTPALRDYLYRTTLIASGHLIEGVTVKKREAVKRSMPKGYGDTNQLIRGFGIWIAWKIGNVAAPAWVSAAPQPIQATVAALAKRKKPEKPESPRVPPERQSTRVLELAQAQAEAEAQARSQSQPTLLDLCPTASDSTIKDESVIKKPRTTPKTSGLGPKRVACDTCRKRRIKCRHKEEPDTPRDSLPYSSSIELAEPGLSLDGTSSPMIGDPSSSLGTYGEPTPLNTYNTQMSTSDSTFASPASGKKPGRSKACEECRKSKRRCVHDENGKIDPIKLQEPSKPRGSGSAKRPRTSDEMPNKKAKRANNNGDITPAEAILVGQAQSALAEAGLAHVQSFNDEMIDPALMQMGDVATEKEVAQSGYYPANSDDFEVNGNPSATNQAIAALALQAQAQTQADIGPLLDPRLFADSNGAAHGSPNPDQQDVIHQTNTETELQSRPALLASPPNSIMNDADVNEDTVTHEGEGDIKKSIEMGNELLDPDLHLDTPISTSRQSSRQPKTATAVSAPMQQVMDQPPPAVLSRQSSESNEGSKSDHTAHSGQTATTIGMNHDTSSSHATSPMTATENAGRERSNSAKDGHPTLGDTNADEESLRLIRELQMQERGLRRRG